MNITVKLKLCQQIVIGEFQGKYTNVVRYAFNRAMDGKTKFEIFSLVKTLNNVDILDLSWKREAVKIGYTIAKSALARYNETHNKKELKVIFGSKKLFYKRSNGKITREEYKCRYKLQPITCEGSKADHLGNRKFNFDFNTFDGKVRLGDKVVPFSCHKTSKKNMVLLSRLQELVLKKECGFTCKLTNEYFYIVFDLDKIPKDITYKKQDNVTLAIDMNPNYIGISITDKNNDILHKRCYDLSKLTTNNKRKYELTQIVVEIKKLCIKYNVCYVGFEKLAMKPSDKKKGRRFNKQVNNEWCRLYFVNSLKKHLTLIGCKYQELAAQYSSFIGQLTNPNDTDSIAASIELNRRLKEYKKQYIDRIEPHGPIVYPKFSLNYLNRWKKEEIREEKIKDWRTAYNYVKEFGHSYRFLYVDYVKRKKCRVFRLKSKNSLVTYITE